MDYTKKILNYNYKSNPIKIPIKRPIKRPIKIPKTYFANIDNHLDANHENNHENKHENKHENNIQTHYLKCSHFNPDKASPPNSWKSRLDLRLEKYV